MSNPFSAILRIKKRSNDQQFWGEGGDFWLVFRLWLKLTSFIDDKVKIVGINELEELDVLLTKSNAKVLGRNKYIDKLTF